jgi:hypothetical protein
MLNLILALALGVPGQAATAPKKKVVVKKKVEVVKPAEVKKKAFWFIKKKRNGK